MSVGSVLPRRIAKRESERRDASLPLPLLGTLSLLAMLVAPPSRLSIVGLL
jgi:hypothetical protein